MVVHLVIVSILSLGEYNNEDCNVWRATLLNIVLQTFNEIIEFLPGYEIENYDSFKAKVDALAFLRYVVNQTRDPSVLRAILAKERNGIEVSQLDDHQMLEALAEHLFRGEIKVRRTPKSRPPSAIGIEPEPQPYLTPREVEQREKARRGERGLTPPPAVPPIIKKPKNTNQEKSHQDKAIIGDFSIGKKIGEGGFGEVFEVEGDPGLAIKIAKGSHGKANNQLETEAKNLQLLTEKGFPTAFEKFVDVVDENGVRRQAIVMQKVDGVLSKKLLQTGKFSDVSPSAAELKLVNQTTLKQLKEFKETAANSNVVIDDIQFMIDKDGSIKLIDPARITALSGLKPKQIKPRMNAFMKRIDGIIRDFEKIFNGYK